MKNKGYSLIELLAVIVILAIIVIIATPIVSGIIDMVRKEAFRLTGENIVNAAEYTYGRNFLKGYVPNELVFSYTGGNETVNIIGNTLDYRGTRPNSGNVVINKDGDIAIALANEKYCVKKEYTNERVQIFDLKDIETCSIEVNIPSIFLNGPSDVEIEINTEYIEEGVTAIRKNGEIISDVQIIITKNGITENSVDVSKLGEYNIKYRVSDAGDTNEVERRVKIVDTIPPVITVPKNLSLKIDDIGVYDLKDGVTITDNSLEEISIDDVIVISNISKQAGNYMIEYRVSDSSGNVGSANRIVDVRDNDAPIITILGDNPLNVYVDLPYIELGATATDDEDGDISDSIIISGNVDITTPDIYYIKYYVEDSDGNESYATREIKVIDNVGPVVTFGTNGNNIYSKNHLTSVNVFDVHGEVVDMNYQWTTSTSSPTTDSFNQTFINGGIIATPSGETGDYYLWIKAVDNVNNETIVRSNVFKLDNQPPILTVPENTTVTISQVDDYNLLANVNVTDNSLEEIPIVVSGSIARIVGSYSISYIATDSSGNSTSVVRIIDVIDNEAPIITILGDNPMNINAGTKFSDPGATAYDDADGDVTDKIVANGNVNILIIGSYHITYTVSDNTGNVATATRTVNVVDNIAPVITTATAGSMLYKDPTFISGNNNINIYNNTGNGNVSITRKPITGAPIGSGYGLEIKTTGEATPGYGGFYFATPTSANKVVITKIVAKIPAGYKINFASNAIGTGANHKWLTVQDGTGDWEEYVYQVTAGSAGNFSTTNYFYLTGPATPTTDNPLIWQLAYATVIDKNKWDSSNSIIATALDIHTGIVAYGINQSSTVAPTYTNVINKKEVGIMINNITNNGTYYIWMKDGAGNVSNKEVNVEYIDKTAPDISFSNNGNSTYNKNHSTTVTVTDNQSGVYKSYYLWTTSSSQPAVNAINNEFNSGSTMTSSNLNGIYYLWVRSIDNAGNEKTIRTNAFNFDSNPPFPGYISISGTLGNNGWYRSGVTISAYGGYDNESGIRNYELSHTAIGSNTSGTVIVLTTYDNAGNYASTSTSVKIDMTPPTVGDISASGTSCGYTMSGWYRSMIFLSGSGMDLQSGVDRTVVSPSSMSSSGMATITTYDRAGNSSSKQQYFSIDSTSPSILSVSPTMSSISKNSMTSFSCSAWDLGSGLQSCTASPSMYFAGSSGTVNVTFTATDKCGNTSTTYRMYSVN